MTRWDDLSRKYNKGDTIFKSTDEGQSAFVIQSGKVKLTRDLDGDQILVEELVKGDIFGIPSMLLNTTRLYYAVAEENDTVIVEITANIFSDILQKNPEIALRILFGLSEVLVNTEITLAKMYSMVHSPKPEILVESNKVPLPASVRASLIFPGNQMSFPLIYTETVIGRRDAFGKLHPDIDLSEADKDKYISRRHGVVFFQDSSFFLKEELGVINGTYLNGERLKSGTPYNLKVGDQIKFCNIEAIFHIGP